jgi:hypothetical protein
MEVLDDIAEVVKRLIPVLWPWLDNIPAEYGLVVTCGDVQRMLTPTDRTDLFGLLDMERCYSDSTYAKWQDCQMVCIQVVPGDRIGDRLLAQFPVEHAEQLMWLPPGKLKPLSLFGQPMSGMEIVWLVKDAALCATFWQEAEFRLGTFAFPGKALPDGLNHVSWKPSWNDPRESRGQFTIVPGKAAESADFLLGVRRLELSDIATAMCHHNAWARTAQGTTGQTVKTTGVHWIRHVWIYVWEIKLVIGTAVAALSMFSYHLTHGPTSSLGGWAVAFSFTYSIFMAWSQQLLWQLTGVDLIIYRIWNGTKPVYPHIGEWWGESIGLLEFFLRWRMRARASKLHEFIYTCGILAPILVGVLFIWLQAPSAQSGPHGSFPLWTQHVLLVEGLVAIIVSVLCRYLKLTTPAGMELSWRTVQHVAHEVLGNHFIGCSKTGTGGEYRTPITFHRVERKQYWHADPCRMLGLKWTPFEKDDELATSYGKSQLIGTPS